MRVVLLWVAVASRRRSASSRCSRGCCRSAPGARRSATTAAYWSKIEAYLAARTEAQFTHGICPDCNEKLLAEEGHAHSDSLGKHGRSATNS